MVKGDTPAQDRIEKSKFEAMCGIMCTKEEIADIFDVDADTLNTWCKETYGDTFSVIYKKKTSTGKMSLRRMQFKQAEKNSAMAIWLGKQWLGQRDYLETGLEVKKTPEIDIKVVDNSKLGKVLYEGKKVKDGKE